MEAKIEDAIQAMTCDCDMYALRLYYADVQLYTIFKPSKFFVFQSLSWWEVKHVNAERKISRAWNSVVEND